MRFNWDEAIHNCICTITCLRLINTVFNLLNYIKPEIAVLHKN